jgi:hypothetical protein
MKNLKLQDFFLEICCKTLCWAYSHAHSFQFLGKSEIPNIYHIAREKPAQFTFIKKKSKAKNLPTQGFTSYRMFMHGIRKTRYTLRQINIQIFRPFKLQPNKPH